MNVYEKLSSGDIQLLEEGTYYYLCDMLSNTREEIINALQDDDRMELLASAMTIATISLGKNILFSQGDGNRCPLCNHPLLEYAFEFDEGIDVCQHCGQSVDRESNEMISLILTGDADG